MRLCAAVAFLVVVVPLAAQENLTVLPAHDAAPPRRILRAYLRAEAQKHFDARRAAVGNDTLVTEGWLEHLVGLATLHPDLGLVGPVANYAPPAQLAEGVPCRLPVTKDLRTPAGTAPAAAELELEALDRFAREWRAQHRTQWIEVEQLAGFCVLVKREVLQTAGLFDARPAGLEFFDAQALSLRARQCGYRLACCRDVFVNHFGSRTAAPRPAGGGSPPPGPPAPR